MRKTLKSKVKKNNRLLNNESSATPTTDGPESITGLLETLSAIALEGLNYAPDPYDTARYHKILDLVSRRYASLSGHDAQRLRDTLLQNISAQTPKLGVAVMVVNDRDEALIMKRVHEQRWGVPQGWVDVGETPLEAARREVKEETGLDVEISTFWGVTTVGPETDAGLTHQVALRFAAAPVPYNAAVKLNHEHTDFQWLPLSQVETADIEWYLENSVFARDYKRARDQDRLYDLALFSRA